MMGMGYRYGRQSTIQSAFEEYCKRQRSKYGSKFDQSGLDERFVSYYNSGERIKVGFVGADGQGYEVKSGTVSATTGWRPSFMLKLTKRSTGSSYLIGERDVVLRDGDFRAEVFKARVKGAREAAVAGGERPVEPSSPDQAERAGKFGVTETDWTKMVDTPKLAQERVRARRKQRVREVATDDGVAIQLNMFA